MFWLLRLIDAVSAAVKTVLKTVFTVLAIPFLAVGLASLSVAFLLLRRL